MRTPARFTDAEFERLVRSGGFGDARVELRRGMIVRMSPQFVPHAHVKMEVAFALIAGLRAVGLDWKVWNEVSVGFGGGFQPMPDIVVFDFALLPPNHNGPIPAAAVKLIVEVSDTTLADDLGEKLEDYASGGLQEYWVADVQGRLVLQHSGPKPSAYARREPRRFGEAWSWITRPDIIVDTTALLSQP